MPLLPTGLLVKTNMDVVLMLPTELLVKTNRDVILKLSTVYIVSENAFNWVVIEN